MFKITIWKILLGNENEYSKESVRRGIIGVGTHFTDFEIKKILQKGYDYAKTLKKQKVNLLDYDLEIRFITNLKKNDFVFHCSRFFSQKNIVMLGKVREKPYFFTNQDRGNWNTYFRVVANIEWKEIPFDFFSEEELKRIKHSKFPTFRRVLKPQENIPDFSIYDDTRVNEIWNSFKGSYDNFVFIPEGEESYEYNLSSELITAKKIHSKVVNRLEAIVRKAGYKTSNINGMDLHVRKSNREILFEAKSDSCSTSIQKGIGQLFLYGLDISTSAIKILVLPKITNTLREKLELLSIKILLYNIEEDDISENNRNINFRKIEEVLDI